MSTYPRHTVSSRKLAYLLQREMLAGVDAHPDPARRRLSAWRRKSSVSDGRIVTAWGASMGATSDSSRVAASQEPVARW